MPPLEHEDATKHVRKQAVVQRRVERAARHVHRSLHELDDLELLGERVEAELRCRYIRVDGDGTKRRERAHVEERADAFDLRRDGPEHHEGECLRQAQHIDRPCVFVHGSAQQRLDGIYLARCLDQRYLGPTLCCAPPAANLRRLVRRCVVPCLPPRPDGAHVA